MDLLAAEGIKFINNAEVGKNVDAQQILQDNDAVLLAVGSTCPRNIPLPGEFPFMSNSCKINQEDLNGVSIETVSNLI